MKDDWLVEAILALILLGVVITLIVVATRNADFFSPPPTTLQPLEQTP